jgi:hypothetical protein
MIVQIAFVLLDPILLQKYAMLFIFSRTHTTHCLAYSSYDYIQLERTLVTAKHLAYSITRFGSRTRPE